MSEGVFSLIIGNRSFLNLFGRVVPVDQITRIETDGVRNGGCSNSVRIDLQGDESLYYTYENADALRQYLADHRMM